MRLTRRQMLLSGSMLIAGACTRPGSETAPQRFGSRLAGHVQVLDGRLALALPPGAVAPTTISSFTSELGVKVTVVPARLDTVADVGQTDVALIDDVTLAGLIQANLVEKIDRGLVSNAKLLLPPFDNPSYDHGGRHSVPKDYVAVGYAVSTLAVPVQPPTWSGFFHLAGALPGRVSVPPDRDVVIGAALTAAGHDWNSSSSSDMTDAADILLPLREDLVVGGSMVRRRLPAPLVAALCFGEGFATPAAGIRFVVPRDGTMVRARCYCIPPFAPDPVSAHAWLNHTLDPAVAAAETRYTRRATPVGPAVYQLPASLLANEAIFPPALPPVPLTFANVTPAGAVLRADLWREFTATRRRRPAPR